MGETNVNRIILSPYCKGLGLDLGFGGDAIVKNAITFDMPIPYTNVGLDKQIMRGDCRNLSMFCDESLDYIYHSHLIEDFVWKDIIPIIWEWRRVLKYGGLLITCAPDEQIYSNYCKKNNHPYNMAHKNKDFSLEAFKSQIIENTGSWEALYECSLINTYSWHLVLKKTADFNPANIPLL